VIATLSAFFRRNKRRSIPRSLSFIIGYLDRHDVEIGMHRTTSSKRHWSRQRRWRRARAGRRDDDKRETKGRRHPPGYIPDALWPAKPRPRTSHPRGFPSCLHPPACAFFPFFSFLILPAPAQPWTPLTSHCLPMICLPKISGTRQVAEVENVNIRDFDSAIQFSKLIVIVNRFKA